MGRLSPASVIRTELISLLEDEEKLQEELKETRKLISKYQKALEVLEMEEEK